MKLTNNTRGPRVVNTTTGPVTLAPGASQDLDVTDAEAAGLDALLAGPGTASADTTQLKAGGDAVDPEVQNLVDGNNKAQLLEIAETEGVEGVTEDNNKTEIATKIIEGRNA